MSGFEFHPEVQRTIHEIYGPIVAGFKITSVPQGGAPFDIRRQWVGETLPIREYAMQDRSPVFFDKISNQYIESLDQIAICGLDAVIALRNSGKHEAADYWMETGYAIGTLIFRSNEGILVNEEL